VSLKIVGTIIAEDFATGSKSQRRAVFLQTEKDRLLLRRAGENAMHDPTLEAMVGQSVEVDGEVHRDVLIATQIRKLIS
jgi:hypothetical protein